MGSTPSKSGRGSRRAPAPARPLAHQTVRLWALRAICAVAEGAVVLPRDTAGAFDSPAKTVAAALGDAQRRVAALGGRAGMPRSVGTLYGGLIVLFLGTEFRGASSKHIFIPQRWLLPQQPPTGYSYWFQRSAVTRDGSTLLLLPPPPSHANRFFVVRVADGAFTHPIGTKGSGKLQFEWPMDIYVAPDDCVFIADCRNDRVQVLTPELKFKAFVGVGQLTSPISVCTDDEHVVVCDRHSICMFSHHDFVRLRRIPNESFGRHVEHFIRLVRFVPGGRHVVVLDYAYSLCLVTLDGDFVRCMVERCQDVACSELGEIVAIGAHAYGVYYMRVYWTDGTLLRSFPIAERQLNVTLTNSRVFLTSAVGTSVMLG